MPEDITLVVAGYLSHLGNIDVVVSIVVCMLGVLMGDFTLFLIGRKFGKKAFTLPVIRSLMTPERVAFAEKKLHGNARKIMFTARFLAGLRAPIYLTAGTLGVKPQIFVGMDFLAAILSVPALVCLGYFFGDEIDIALLWARKIEHYIMIVLGALIVFFIIRSLLKRRSTKIKEVRKDTTA